MFRLNVVAERRRQVRADIHVRCGFAEFFPNRHSLDKILQRFAGSFRSRRFRACFYRSRDCSGGLLSFRICVFVKRRVYVGCGFGVVGGKFRRFLHKIKKRHRFFRVVFVVLFATEKFGFKLLAAFRIVHVCPRIHIDFRNAPVSPMCTHRSRSRVKRQIEHLSGKPHRLRLLLRGFHFRQVEFRSELRYARHSTAVFSISDFCRSRARERAKQKHARHRFYRIGDFAEKLSVHRNTESIVNQCFVPDGNKLRSRFFRHAECRAPCASHQRFLRRRRSRSARHLIKIIFGKHVERHRLCTFTGDKIRYAFPERDHRLQVFRAGFHGTDFKRRKQSRLRIDSARNQIRVSVPGTTAAKPCKRSRRRAGSARCPTESHNRSGIRERNAGIH